MRKVAALYVSSLGPYFRIAACDPFDEERDARTYAGELPIVAHPPCKRWGRWWGADGSNAPGMDGGLFLHAAGELRRCGGVLEHPEGSHAWARFNLPRPMRGSWLRAPLFHQHAWTTCIDQINYGHKARKRTWLIYVGVVPPQPMDWSDPPRQEWYLCKPGRTKTKPGRDVPLLTPQENIETPLLMACVLVEMARNCGGAK